MTTHFNKRTTSTAEGGHANIKRALERTLGDLPEVVRLIREKIEDQLRKIRLQHSSDKNGNIRASLNIMQKVSMLQQFYPSVQASLLKL